MKSLPYSILLGCCLMTSSLSATAKTTQLNVHTSSAQPAHLTTRIEWAIYPKLQYNNQDLSDQDRAAILRVHADSTGQVTQVTVQESTGLKALDQLLIKATQQAKVKPYQKDGNILPVIGYQVFQLNLIEATEACNYAFDSRIWLAQNQSKKTTFNYQQQPVLEVSDDELQHFSRHIKFNFKVDAKGTVKSIKIKQGSGLYALDQKVVNALQHAQIENKRSAKTLWLYKARHFKDEIFFDLKACQ